MQGLLKIIQEMKNAAGLHDQIAHGTWSEGLGGVRQLPRDKLDYATAHDITAYADKHTPATNDRLSRTKLYVDAAKLWSSDAKLLLKEPLKEMAGMLEAYGRAIGSDPEKYAQLVSMNMRATGERINLTRGRTDSPGVSGIKYLVEDELRKLAKDVATDTATTEKVASLAGRVMGLYHTMYPPTDEQPPEPMFDVVSNIGREEDYLYDL